MALLIVSVCNERLQAMASINGVAFVSILSSDGQVVDSATVDIRASATFSQLSPGSYNVELYHPDVAPSTVRESITVSQARDIVGVIFCYLEAERQFLNIRTFIR